MSFVWTKYIQLAQELASDSPPIPEAKARSAISRAYYAAFHYAKSYIEIREGIPQVDNIHHYVISRFSSINHSDTILCDRISDDLDVLRRDRNKADYDDTFRGGLGEIRKKAADAITVAKRIISNVDRL